VPIDTNARVDLGITLDLGDVGCEAKLDCALGASLMTSPTKDRAPGINGRGPEIPVHLKPRLPQLPIPVQTRSYLNCFSISINTRVSLDIKVHSMLLKIILLIVKLSSDLGIGAGTSEHPPDAVFVLVCRFEKEYSDELLIDTSPTGICLNRLVSSIGTTCVVFLLKIRYGEH